MRDLHSYPSALERLDEVGRREFWATLALRHTKKLGLRSAKRLLDHFGSAYAAVREVHDWSAARVRTDKAEQLVGGEWRAGAKEQWERTRRLNAEILLWTDPRYPERLRLLPDAPSLLYCRGDITLLRAHCVAVVGSRRCSAQGLAAAEFIARRLAACGITIVSGLALGIDRQAHAAALPQLGKTIAVLGTGIDVPYPKENAELFTEIADGSLLLTEFAPASMPEARHFPVRNRLISGLSLGVLIVEAAKQSGSLITARLALEQNREVYAVPVSVFGPLSEGCRDLVRRGAHPVFSAEDILLDLAPLLKEYGIQPPADPLPEAPPKIPAPDAKRKGSPRKSVSCNTVPLAGQNASEAAPAFPGQTKEEREAGSILALLREEGVCHIDLLARRSGMPVAHLSALLVRLELPGLVRRLPGMRYGIV